MAGTIPGRSQNVCHCPFGSHGVFESPPSLVESGPPTPVGTIPPEMSYSSSSDRTSLSKRRPSTLPSILVVLVLSSYTRTVSPPIFFTPVTRPVLHELPEPLVRSPQLEERYLLPPGDFPSCTVRTPRLPRGESTGCASDPYPSPTPCPGWIVCGSIPQPLRGFTSE